MDNTLLKTHTNKYEQLFPGLNERSKRLIAAADANALGYGGITLVHLASGLDLKTIRTGITELEDQKNVLPPDQCRRPGGGRKPITATDAGLENDLLKLVENVSRGDPEVSLQWTNKSTRVLAKELSLKNHSISHVKVGQLLKEQGFSLQSNRKTEEGADHPDRDEQFRHINTAAKHYLESHDPVISVDTKKKELIGNYKNNGQQWLPKGQPIQVNGHDFPDKELGRAVPYGVYDLNKNDGYVNVGVNHDTGEFAVASIKRWWKQFGKERYGKSKRILITADSGGSNGYRLRLWKKELQKFANQTGLTVSVCHLPPGTSKWNKIEHKLFSFISINWKGQPLTSYEVIVNLISSTKTETGLRVYAAIDNHHYELKQKVSDEEMRSLNLERDGFHGEWNYTIKPGVA